MQIFYQNCARRVNSGTRWSEAALRGLSRGAGDSPGWRRHPRILHRLPECDVRGDSQTEGRRWAYGRRAGKGRKQQQTEQGGQKPPGHSPHSLHGLYPHFHRRLSGSL